MKCRGCWKNGTKQQCENVCNNLDNEVKNSRSCGECREYLSQGIKEACAKCVPLQNAMYCAFFGNELKKVKCEDESEDESWKQNCIQRKALCQNINSNLANDIEKAPTCGECREHLKLLKQLGKART